jgi:hypothetical protein
MHTKSRRKLILSTGLSLIALLATVSVAQTPKPSPSPSFNGEGEKHGNYVISSSAEIGARGISVNGDGEKYRSDLNYRPGVRLFNSSFFIKDNNKGMKLFDEALIQASGWGGDPTGSLRIDMSRTGVYKFNSNFRKVDYYNNVNNHAIGWVFPAYFGTQHKFLNVDRNFGDMDLTVFPESDKLRLRFGYSYNNQDGPGTWNIRYPGFEAPTFPGTTGTRGDEFMVNSTFKNNAQDLRAGIEGQLLSFNLGLNYGHRIFKDETRLFLNSFSLGNDTSQNTTGTISATVNNFLRRYPTKGTIDYFNFYIQRTFAKKLDFAGRFIYAIANSDVGQTDVGSGTSSGTATNSGTARVIFDLDQIFVAGKVKRPQSRGDIGLTYHANKWFRISNTFNFDQFTIGGTESSFENMVGRSASSASTPFNSISNILFTEGTRYRRFTNLIEGDVQVNKHFAFNIGYRYTHRKVGLGVLERNLVSNTEVESEFEEDSNTTNSVIVGAKIKPTNYWNLYLDFERGQSDNVFVRLANNKYTNFRVRSVTYLKRFTLNFSGLIRNNDNPGLVSPSINGVPSTVLARDTVANSRTRYFSGSVDYTPLEKWTFSAGYTYNHQTTDTDVLVPVGTPINTSTTFAFGKSLYFVKDNYFFFDVTAQPVRRVTLFASYRIDDDKGQGSMVATNPYDIITSYPMRFQTPEAKVSFRLNRWIDWNVGYKYYSYRETQFASPYAWVVVSGAPNRLFVPANQNYTAHMPYTSLTFYFGRE